MRAGSTLAVAVSLLLALTGCVSKGGSMGDCSGPNSIHQGGKSSAITDPPLTPPSPYLQVAGGYLTGSSSKSRLVLNVVSIEAQKDGTAGQTKNVELGVGESATFLGFTVKVTGICDAQTYYSATFDPSAYSSASPTP